jgi:hypothetical protein
MAGTRKHSLLVRGKQSSSATTFTNQPVLYLEEVVELVPVVQRESCGDAAARQRALVQVGAAIHKRGPHDVVDHLRRRHACAYTSAGVKTELPFCTRAPHNAPIAAACSKRESRSPRCPTLSALITKVQDTVYLLALAAPEQVQLTPISLDPNSNPERSSREGTGHHVPYRESRTFWLSLLLNRSSCSPSASARASVPLGRPLLTRRRACRRRSVATLSALSLDSRTSSITCLRTAAAAAASETTSGSGRELIARRMRRQSRQQDRQPARQAATAAVKRHMAGGASNDCKTKNDGKAVVGMTAWLWWRRRATVVGRQQCERRQRHIC